MKPENYCQIYSPKIYFLFYKLVSFVISKETIPAKQFVFIIESIPRKFELTLFNFLWY